MNRSALPPACQRPKPCLKLDSQRVAIRPRQRFSWRRWLRMRQSLQATRARSMANDIKLRAPLQVTGDDLERALFEQSMEELAVAQVFDRLRGIASVRAAEELNRALEVDIFEVLTEAWAKVPAVRNAVHLSALV